jgi:hypothetical protein
MPTHNIYVFQDIYTVYYTRNILVCSHFTGMYVQYLPLFWNPRFSYCISKSCYEGVISEALLEYILERWVGLGVWGNRAVTRVRNTGQCIIRQKGKDNIEHRGR